MKKTATVGQALISMEGRLLDKIEDTGQSFKEYVDSKLAPVNTKLDNLDRNMEALQGTVKKQGEKMEELHATVKQQGGKMDTYF